MRKHHVVEKEEDYASEWKTKSVVWPDKDGYVLKYFKDDIKDYLYSYDEQLDILALKKRYFWKYIPETVLVREDWDKYYIKQKFIKWKLLKFVDVEDLPPKTLDALFDLFKNYITFSKDEWVVMDVYWYQRDLEGLDNIWARRFAVYIWDSILIFWILVMLLFLMIERFIWLIFVILNQCLVMLIRDISRNWRSLLEIGFCHPE